MVMQLGIHVTRVDQIGGKACNCIHNAYMVIGLTYCFGKVSNNWPAIVLLRRHTVDTVKVTDCQL